MDASDHKYHPVLSTHLSHKSSLDLSLRTKFSQLPVRHIFPLNDFPIQPRNLSATLVLYPSLTAPVDRTPTLYQLNCPSSPGWWALLEKVTQLYRGLHEPVSPGSDGPILSHLLVPRSLLGKTSTRFHHSSQALCSSYFLSTHEHNLVKFMSIYDIPKSQRKI